MYFTRQQQMANFAENRQPLPHKTNKGGNQGVENKRVNRRALGDIGNVVGSRNQQPVAPKNMVPVHRPITRRYVATLASNQQLAKENEYVQLEENEHCQQEDTIEMEDESEDTCEIEMEDPNLNDEEELSDMMEDDSRDPLLVSEYVQDIYNSYKATESLSTVAPDYMNAQSDINERMRGILVDWLIEVHQKFQLMEETLYLTVNIIDRYLARKNVVRKQLQLVGVTAMFIACKYEEVSVPVVDDFVLISDNAYTKDELLQMEKSILNTLLFTLSVPTPYKFMTKFLRVAGADDDVEAMAYFLVELSLVDYSALRFQPSVLAAAAIYTARCTLGRSSRWNKSLESFTGYAEGQLWECGKMMVELHDKAGQGKLTTVHNKYSASRYGCASKVGPALYLIDMPPTLYM